MQVVENEEVVPPTTCKHQTIANMSNMPEKTIKHSINRLQKITQAHKYAYNINKQKNKQVNKHTIVQD